MQDVLRYRDNKLTCKLGMEVQTVFFPMQLNHRPLSTRQIVMVQPNGEEDNSNLAC